MTNKTDDKGAEIDPFKRRILKLKNFDFKLISAVQGRKKSTLEPTKFVENRRFWTKRRLEVQKSEKPIFLVFLHIIMYIALCTRKDGITDHFRASGVVRFFMSKGIKYDETRALSRF